MCIIYIKYSQQSIKYDTLNSKGNILVNIIIISNADYQIYFINSLDRRKKNDYVMYFAFLKYIIKQYEIKRDIDMLRIQFRTIYSDNYSN